MHELFSFIFADERKKLGKAITTCLGVVGEKADYFFESYKPQILMDGERCIAGRASLERNTRLTNAPAKLDLFVFIS